MNTVPSKDGSDRGVAGPAASTASIQWSAEDAACASGTNTPGSPAAQSNSAECVVLISISVNRLEGGLNNMRFTSGRGYLKVRAGCVDYDLRPPATKYRTFEVRVKHWTQAYPCPCCRPPCLPNGSYMQHAVVRLLIGMHR
jgi:hypothetical protein